MRYAILLCSLLAVTLSAAPVITDIQPRLAEVGETITVTGTGFVDPLDQLTLGETNITPTSVSGTTIEFTVPDGVSGGQVSVDVAGDVATFEYPIGVVREISGTFNPIFPGRNGYVVGSMDQAVDPDFADGTFTADIRRDEVVMLMAVGADNQPVYLAVALPGEDNFVLDVNSTARALLFMSPFVGTTDVAAAPALLQLIDDNNIADDLVTALTTIMAEPNNRDYNEDVRYEDALVTATIALLEVIESEGTARSGGGARAFNSGAPDGVRFKDINAPFASKSIISQVNVDSNGDFFLNLKPVNDGVLSLNRNVVDWRSVFYQLNPDFFVAGFDSVDAVTHDFQPTRLSSEPIARDTVPAKLLDVDLLGQAISFGFKLLKSSVESDKLVDGINLGSEPGVFISRSLSGNLNYGTTLFTAMNQSGTIDNLGLASEWRAALITNIGLGAIDFAGIFFKLENYFSEKELVTLIEVVGKAILKSFFQADGDARVSNTEMLNTLINTSKDLIKKLIETAIKSKLKSATDPDNAEKLVGLAGGAAKTVLGYFNVIGKVAKAGKLAQRASGIIRGNTLALESTIVVIGDPFLPRVTKFSPAKAHRNRKIDVQTLNLPPEDVTLKFGKLTAGVDPNGELTEGDFDVLVDAAELERNGNVLVAKVPDLRTAATSHGNIFSIVVVTDKGIAVSSTAFTYQPDPIIESVLPATVPSGGTITIMGQNFSDRPLNNLVEINSGSRLHIQFANETRIEARLPELQDNMYDDLVVKIEGAPSNAASVNVVTPIESDPSVTQGLTIRITKLDMSNAPDGEISILEAMLLANGTLGRPIERHLACENIQLGEPGYCGGFQVREDDHVTGENSEGFGGGLFATDRIVTDGDLEGQTMVVTDPSLLTFTPGDEYDFGDIILDGTGLNANAITLNGDQTQNGASDIKIENVTLIGFGGHGIELANNAIGNSLEDVTIIGCGGHGIFMHGRMEDDGEGGQVELPVRDNKLVDIKIHNNGTRRTGTDLHGIYLMGELVTGNRIDVNNGLTIVEAQGTANDNPGYGVLIDGGATKNTVNPGSANNNGLGGILITGTETDNNVIGANTFVVPRIIDIYNNGGPGIKLTSGVNGTTIRYVNPAGNNGDGILLEGPDCDRNVLDSVYTSIDLYSSQDGFSQAIPVPLPNQGNGIRLTNGCQHNVIGSRIANYPTDISETEQFTPRGFGQRSAICANRDDGILLEGQTTAFNLISSCHIGSVEPYVFLSFDVLPYFPNGKNGIRITDNSNQNILGDRHSFLDLHVVGALEAGILIDNGHDNRIIGSQIGVQHAFGFDEFEGNAVGIHLKNGASGNLIGDPGAEVPFVQDSQGFITVYRYGNSIGNNDIGILIEDCSNSRGNFIQNNRIGLDDLGGARPNEVGIKIVNSEHNTIGGKFADERNTIARNDKFGIEISGTTILAPESANTIVNNIIEFTGAEDEDAGISGTTITGVGVMVHETSQDVIIGHHQFPPNVIKDNVLGIYVNGSNGTEIRNNQLHDNKYAGIRLHNASFGSVGGGAPFRNTIYKNGDEFENGGGLILTGGSTINQISSNLIGDDGSQAPGNGNNGIGILVEDSPANTIGGNAAEGNTIVSNAEFGIQVTGNASDNNIINFNNIGVAGDNIALGNGDDGIRVDNGASDTSIGDEFTDGNVGVIAPNNIANNGGDGVEVANAPRTLIKNNSITANTGRGIRTDLGNPPIIDAEYIARRRLVFGSVESHVPIGSVVQVFCDPADDFTEGDVFLGDAKVDVAGNFRVSVQRPVHRNFSVTVTPTDSNSTFDFFTDVDFPKNLRIQGGSGARGTQSVGAGTANVPVFPMTFTSASTDARIDEITFTAGGTLADATDILAVNLYRDNDGDGVITASDELLGGPFQYVADNGTIRVELEDRFLDSGESETWILTYDLAVGLPANATFTASIAESADFTFEGLLSVNPTATDLSALFPVQSDTFIISFTDTDNDRMDDDWENTHFGNLDQLPGGDFDNDNVFNITEFKFGSDPNNNGDVPAGEIYNMPVRAGWQFLSLPLIPTNDAVGVLFDELNLGEIFVLQDGHSRESNTLTVGQGFWIFFAGTPPYNPQIVGTRPGSFEAQLTTGWNGIGPIDSINIPVDPTFDSPFFFWDGRRFQAAMTLQPGTGYFSHVSAPIGLELTDQ